jgi:hypothetical protein
MTNKSKVKSYRPLRVFETAPDAFVEFRSAQRQWAFSYKYPAWWRLYRFAARIRCLVVGHEWSPCWEEEKFDLSRLGRTETHCVFCGKQTPKVLP